MPLPVAEEWCWPGAVAGSQLEGPHQSGAEEWRAWLKESNRIGSNADPVTAAKSVYEQLHNDKK